MAVLELLWPLGSDVSKGAQVNMNYRLPQGVQVYPKAASVCGALVPLKGSAFHGALVYTMMTPLGTPELPGGAHSVTGDTVV